MTHDTQNPSDPTQPHFAPSNPGDDAPAGTPGTGEDVCDVCGGSGEQASGQPCPNCGGTGKIVEGIGGG